MTAIVFLHIPKTAGQTIHRELCRLAGPGDVSPIRVHTEAPEGGTQFPAGYRLYSGHLDWTDLDGLSGDRFVFTVFRDPRERIASFYFFLLNQARSLAPEVLARSERTGMRKIVSCSADDYFFGGDASWTRFIHDHYDNAYCTYLATRRIRGWSEVSALSDRQKVGVAKVNLPRIDRIYSTTNLAALENDIATRFDTEISVVGTYVNAGHRPRNERRWPRLLERIESDRNARKLESFVSADELLLNDLQIAV